MASSPPDTVDETAVAGDENGDYKAPAQKTVKEILQTDAEDESLRKYKQTLLGADADKVIIEPDNPKNVLVRSLVLLVDNRPDVVMDLSDVKSLANKSFTIEEGVIYRLRVDFHVQREIVAGLRYKQGVHRLGVKLTEEKLMVGSYAPKTEIQSYTTPAEEAPSGMAHRGKYKIKSLFTDDDKNEWLKWEWTLEIVKKS